MPGVLCNVCDCVPIGVCKCVYVYGYSVVLSVCVCVCVCVCVFVFACYMRLCAWEAVARTRVIPAPHLIFPDRVSGALRPAEAAELTSLFCNSFLIMLVYL